MLCMNFRRGTIVIWPNKWESWSGKRLISSPGFSMQRLLRLISTEMAVHLLLPWWHCRHRMPLMPFLPGTKHCPHLLHYLPWHGEAWSIPHLSLLQGQRNNFSFFIFRFGRRIALSLTIAGCLAFCPEPSWMASHTFTSLICGAALRIGAAQHISSVFLYWMHFPGVCRGLPASFSLWLAWGCIL